MNMNRALTGVLVSAAALASLLSLASPAHALASDCAVGNLCVWKDSGFTGSRYQFSGNNAHWGAYPIADNDSSWYNRKAGTQRVQIYQDGDYHNTTVCVGVGQMISSYAYANDKGSSNKWGGC